MLQQAVHNSRLHVPIIFTLGSLIFFPLLGARDFWGHENEYAEITRIMLLDGNYLLPVFNSDLWADRPIFSFWIALAISWLAGQVNEWTVRLPSALSALALGLVYYHFLRKHFTAQSALLSTVVLASSLLTIHVERHLPVNMVCFLVLVLAMFLFMEVLVFESRRALHIYGAWLFLGLACLTKGPQALLFAIPVIGLYLALSRRWDLAVRLRPLSGILLLVAVVVPWFAYAAWETRGAWIRTFIAQQYFWRYAVGDGQTTGSFAIHSLNYLGFHLGAGLVPWIFLAVPAAMNLWPERDKLRAGAMLYFTLWALSTLVISAYSDRHHGHDLFMLFPPVALALGNYLENLLSSRLTQQASAWTNRFIVLGCLLLVVVGASAPFVAISQFHWTDAPAAGLRIIGVGLIALAVALWWAARQRRYHVVLAGFAGLMIGLNLLVHSFVFPEFNKLKVRAFAERMGSLVEPGGKVGVYRSAMSYKFNFYSRVRHFEPLAGPTELQMWLSKDEAKYILARERFVKEIRAAAQDKVRHVLANETSVPSERWVLLASCRRPANGFDDEKIMSRCSNNDR